MKETFTQYLKKTQARKQLNKLYKNNPRMKLTPNAIKILGKKAK